MLTLIARRSRHYAGTRFLHALGSLESPEVHIDAPLSRHLMHFYERMGDTLALQYGGSAAHNKVLH